MKLKNYVIISILLMVISTCNIFPSTDYSLEIKHADINIGNALRGLSVVDKNIAWASGSGVVYLITTDENETWRTDSVKGASTLNFRSIYVFDGQQAIVVSAGTPARIYKTTDGGSSWRITFLNDDLAIFFDAISFWKQGLVMGDPVEGKLYLLKTEDGGETWNEVSPEGIPASLVSEGGFAASGTYLPTEGDSNPWIGVGGDSAWVNRSTDQGRSWNVHKSPILC